MRSSDTIVIGAGPNGLSCATRLARDGQTVTVLEADELAGSAAAGLAHLVQGLDDRVARATGLSPSALGLRPLATVALDAGGDHLILDGRDTSGPDAAAWAALHQRLDRFARALAPFREMTPPRLSGGNETLKLARLGLGVRGIGRSEFREFLRMILINVADVLDDALTDDRLKGVVAFDTTLGAWLGPRSPNSLILLLNRMSSGAPAWPSGGVRGVMAAMRQAAETAGVTVLTSHEVRRVIVREDRAIGVELANGTPHFARNVVSTLPPRTTLEGLAGPAHLDTGTLRRSRHIRARGAAAKLHLSLSGLPDFRGADVARRLVIAPSIRAVEEAFNAVKYGTVPARPVMEFVLPSVLDGTPARHTLSAIVQFAPHAPDDEDAARAGMLENTLAVLEDHAPGLRALVTGAELLMPYDIARRHRIPGGNWHHAELSVEQMLFLRPAVGLAHYATPLPGLWLGGAGTHPGGGVTGAAGWNAAGAMLRAVRP